jgi:hypothetical protein
MQRVAVRLVGSLIIVATASASLAADPETRDHTIYVDGKPAGESHVTIQTKDDGSIVVSTSAQVAIDRLLVHYKYSYSGKETWKDGKLVGLDSTTNDDGKRFNVSAVAGKENVKVTVNNTEREVHGDVWSTTYARYPDTDRCNKVVHLLDADTGKEMSAKLECVGREETVIAGQKMTCTHFRLRGDVSTDLWYDGQKRLVRQEGVEQGHKVLTEFTGVRK